MSNLSKELSCGILIHQLHHNFIQKNVNYTNLTKIMNLKLLGNERSAYQTITLTHDSAPGNYFLTRDLIAKFVLLVNILTRDSAPGNYFLTCDLIAKFVPLVNILTCDSAPGNDF